MATGDADDNIHHFHKFSPTLIWGQTAKPKSGVATATAGGQGLAASLQKPHYSSIDISGIAAWTPSPGFQDRSTVGDVHYVSQTSDAFLLYDSFTVTG